MTKMRIDPVAKEDVPALVIALKDQDWRVRRRAAWSLGYLGPAAREAIPSLTEALKDKSAAVRNAAQAALKKIKAEK